MHITKAGFGSEYVIHRLVITVGCVFHVLNDESFRSGCDDGPEEVQVREKNGEKIISSCGKLNQRGLLSRGVKLCDEKLKGTVKSPTGRALVDQFQVGLLRPCSVV